MVIKNKKGEIEWIIGFAVALIVAILYRIFFDIIINPFLDSISAVFPTLDIYLGFGLPGITSFVLFIIYSKNLFKSFVIAISTILIFTIVLFLTPSTLPGIP